MKFHDSSRSNRDATAHTVIYHYTVLIYKRGISIKRTHHKYVVYICFTLSAKFYEDTAINWDAVAFYSNATLCWIIQQPSYFLKRTVYVSIVQLYLALRIKFHSDASTNLAINSDKL